MTRATAVLVFLALLVAGAAGPAAAAATGKITGLRAAVEGDRVLASLTLKDGIDRRLVERIESGLPTRIVYEFELARDRKRWYDKGLRRATLEVVAMYDAVTRETTVHSRLDGELVESRTVRGRPAVLETLRRVERVPVFTFAGAPSGVRLLVRARAILGARTILSFIPSEDTTDWEESNKFRLPAAVP